MKKIISFLISLMMVGMVLAAAPPIPMPVSGSVTMNGAAANNLEVTVTNKNNGKSIGSSDVGSLKTDNGRFMFDMSEIDFAIGDLIEVSVCSTDSCKQTFTASYDAFPKELSFNIGGTEVKYVCPDGSEVSNSADCPEQETETKPTSNEDKTTATINADYYQPINVIIGNSKLTKLIDEEIKFNDDDYNVREEIILNAEVQTSLSNKDFGTTPYLVILEGGIEYRYTFDDAITLSEITEDEPLKITLFGVPVEIIKATNSQITFRQGELLQDLKEGDKKEIEGKTLEVLQIGDGYIRINYNGESATVKDQETVSIGGIEVFVKEALIDNKDTVPDLCTIRIGKDIEKTIDSLDKYDEAEVWQWNINLPNYISISNQEDYNELDEDLNPLAEGEKIIIPNDIIIKFYDVTKPATTELEIEVDDEWLRIDGNKEESFSFEGKEYKRVLMSATGIYDKDEVLITNTKVLIGDSETYLEMGSAIIGKLKILLDMTSIYYDGVSFNDKDDEYLDAYGIIFKDAEEAVTDKKGFNVIIPDERPEVTITVGAETVKVDEQGCAVCPVCETTCPTVPSCPTCNACPTSTPCPSSTPCPAVKECEKCPPCGSDSLIAIIGGILALVVTIGGGMKFYKNKMGKGVFQHKHRGVTEYHDANLKHEKPAISHRRWKDNPLGCLADVQKIESGIDLG